MEAELNLLKSLLLIYNNSKSEPPFCYLQRIMCNVRSRIVPRHPNCPKTSHSTFSLLGRKIQKTKIPTEGLYITNPFTGWFGETVRPLDCDTMWPQTISVVWSQQSST